MRRRLLAVSAQSTGVSVLAPLLISTRKSHSHERRLIITTACLVLATSMLISHSGWVYAQKIL